MVPIDEYRIRQDDMLREIAAVEKALPGEFHGQISSALSGDRHLRSGGRFRRSYNRIAPWKRRSNL